MTDKSALHAVIIHKINGITKAKAEQLKKQWIPEKKFMREDSQSYRFRNIPKTKFKSFRSKVINPEITLIYGIN